MRDGFGEEAAEGREMGKGLEVGWRTHVAQSRDSRARHHRRGWRSGAPLCPRAEVAAPFRRGARAQSAPYDQVVVRRDRHSGAGGPATSAADAAAPHPPLRIDGGGGGVGSHIVGAGDRSSSSSPFSGVRGSTGRTPPPPRLPTPSASRMVPKAAPKCMLISTSMPCQYFGSAKGCHFGDECKCKRSDPHSVAPCKNQQGGTCQFGDKCFFRHSDTEVPQTKKGSGKGTEASS